jgi:ABC-2 type transport system ATP-binding protein
LLELRVDRPAPAQAALVAAGFASATLHGRAVHLLSNAAPTSPACPASWPRPACRAVGAAAPLSMEDVFVHRITALEAAQRGTP